MSYISKLKRNIPFNYIFTFLKTLDLAQEVWMIYLGAKGMSLLQLGIIEAVFHITSFLMEVPTGMIADLYGRKTSRILGRLFLIISVSILLLANNFYLFALSFVFCALSYNLESGAGDALVYDSLKEINKENIYMKVQGMQEVFFQVGKLVAYLAGGYLATMSYTLVFLLTIFIGVISLIQSLTFTEPDIKDNNYKKINLFKYIKNQFVESYNLIKNNNRLSFLIIFCEIILTFGTCLFYYIQNYLKGNGYSELQIGIMFAVASLLSAGVSTQVYRLEKLIKEKGILLFMPIISIGCIWGIVLTNYSYIFFILITIVESIIFVAVSDYINKQIPSKNRATILSVASMIFSFFMITIFPLVGHIGDLFSLNFAFKLLATLGSFLVIVNIYVITTINKVRLEAE
ncbi:MFS transporter [Thermohalobacter berrensis]|uniref:MFS transporter n=1 Tax=Thermohalobacter berrensis TaxID=99594 RepID=A0A419T7M1_9FIRM|nr:MFS transporter [Thermohalobacter berrensis]RKD33442.1 MFS transporter [Thermohalobacter berrensis]